MKKENKVTTDELRTKLRGQQARCPRCVKCLATARRSPARFEAPEVAQPLPKLKKILVPTDFSKPSEKAIDYALPFAQQFGAEIIVLHVVEPRTYPESFIMPPQIIEGHLERMDAREEKLLEFSRKRIGTHIKTSMVVQLGKPHEEIVNLAKARRVDLIILATHGYSGMERLFLGSTTEKVIRHAPCPVLVVREKEREFRSRDESSIRSKL